MDKCSRCGSLAINHNCHDRDGKDGDLCDVCYWRKRAEKAKADKLALLSEAEILLRALMQSGDSQQAMSHFKQLKQRIEAE